MRADDIQIIGKNKDTLKISKNGITYIKFFAKDLINEISKYNEMQLTIVGTANLNEWNGIVTPQLFIKDIDIKEITDLSF